MSSSVEHKEYVSMSLEESLGLSDVKHASHCMLYSDHSSDHNSGRNSGHNSGHNSEDISYALLQLRFDGLIGFAGGEVDVHDVDIQHIIDATNRELEEEINYRLKSITKEEWICSHRDMSSQFVQHFFAKRLSSQELTHLETIHMNAQHFPSESLGVFRVPIGGSDPKSSGISRKFLNNFLRQRFAGNARQQFIETIKKRALLSPEDQKWIESNDFDDQSISNSDIEVKTLIRTELPVHYYDESVEVIYGLMVIRDNGLFDFIGSHSSGTDDKNSMLQTLNKCLKSDLKTDWVPISDGSEVLAFDKGLSHVFYIEINSNEFIEIENNFIKSENFIHKSLGILRIPLQFRGNTVKADNYCKRFFKGFLNQSFVNNSRNHLKAIIEMKFRHSL